MSKTEPRFSVIDVETTGGHREGNKITEIAILNIDGDRIVETFQTLINPERSIPASITFLTGITNEMVEEAPKFYEVAKTIIELTEDRIFVAHNVFFDFQFVKREFAELGFRFQRPKLCTVRLARKFLPGHASYSLGKLCNDLGIELTNAHRALDDAKASAQILKLIQSQNDNTDLLNYLAQEKGKVSLPSRLTRDDYDNLPESAGVYYFYNSENQVIYIGKAKNIKKRIASHFRPNIKRKKDVDLKNSIARIETKLLGSELAALLYECSEIKQHAPLFNRSMNRRRFPYSAFLLKDSFDKFRVEVISTGRIPADTPPEWIRSFTKRESAQNFRSRVYEKLKVFELGLKFAEVLNSEQYNELVLKEFSRQQTLPSRCYLKLSGRSSIENCILRIENGSPHVLEYWKSSGEFPDETLKLYSDEDSRTLLAKELRNSKNQYQIYEDERVLSDF